MMPNSVEQSSQTRPGSLGSKSVRLKPSKVFGVTANGTVTNGRINAGSMSPSGQSNYNYTHRAQSAYNTPITQVPDSLSVWICFRSQSSTDEGYVEAVVHGDADYQIIANGTESPANMHVATAIMYFTRTSTASGAYTWRRLSIPFDNNGPCIDPQYILMVATTNKTPGSGSTNDDLFLDDVLLIYNPTLSMGQLASTTLAPGATMSIPFTLTGTMSPDNLNAAANEVIAQLSDANGSFSNPTELGRVTTNTSGSLTVQVPNVPDGQHYQIRVVSTNYPMIGQNIQEVSIAIPTYTVNVTANPAEGGTVSGGGTYSQGTACTISATANEGYTFINWTKDGEVVSTEAVYSFTVTEDAAFVANFETNTATQTIQLSAGTNWFSTNVEITMDDLKAALEAAATGTITITSQRNGMTTYSGTRWRGTLNALDITQSYRITVVSDCEITLEGMPIVPAEHPVSINSGANWIGFPLQENMTITDAFAGFAISGDVINSQREGMATYNGTKWRGTLSNGTLKPGRGYIYKSAATGNRTLVFPTNAK